MCPDALHLVCTLALQEACTNLCASVDSEGLVVMVIVVMVTVVMVIVVKD